jgi:hypothetical protein
VWSAEVRPAVAVAAVLAALVSPPAALADADPPSDTLPGEDVYFAYQPEASPAMERALRVTLQRTRAAGYPLRVAIVATPTDLGGVPQLFGKPQQYADFLAREIAFQYKDALLVVMPAGYGSHNAGRHADRALTDAGAPSGSGGDALPRAAVSAAVRLASAEAHPVAAPKLPGDASGGSALLPVSVLVGMLALGAGLWELKRRSGQGSPDRGDNGT